MEWEEDLLGRGHSLPFHLPEKTAAASFVPSLAACLPVTRQMGRLFETAAGSSLYSSSRTLCLL